MPKPQGWKTLATDLPQDLAYKVASLLTKEGDSIREALRKLLESELKAQERPYLSENLGYICIDAFSGNCE